MESETQRFTVMQIDDRRFKSLTVFARGTSNGPRQGNETEVVSGAYNKKPSFMNWVNELSRTCEKAGLQGIISSL